MTRPTFHPSFKKTTHLTTDKSSLKFITYMFKLHHGHEFGYIKTCLRDTEFLADANGRVSRRFVHVVFAYIRQTGQLTGYAIGDDGD